MTPCVLLDTGVIVALLDKRERRHRDCVEALVGLGSHLATCEPVVAEACYLLRDVPGAGEAVLANVARGSFRVHLRLADEADAVGALMARYADQPMDLADACLVRMAELLDTGRILTLDEDFRRYRWRGRRAFDLLVAPGS